MCGISIRRPTITRIGQILAAAVCAIVIPNRASAAISISFTLPGFVQISGVNDVTFAGVDPMSAATNSQNACVWTNTVSRSYSVTANSSNNPFKLTEPGGSKIDYTVSWSGSANASSGTVLAAGMPSTFMSTALTPTCDTGPSTSASLIITIPAAVLQSMTAGKNYTGTLTLVISPV